MYEKSIGLGTTATGAGALAYTGVSGVAWWAIIGVVAILFGIAMLRLVPRRSRDAQRSDLDG